MQRPTLQNVRIRSTRDALAVFNGVARNVLPLITRRLDAEERRAIVPGNVYVWEERGANSESSAIGMERWTDGMGWGPSRVRDEFLFYHQREAEVGEDSGSSSATPWAQMISQMAQPQGINSIQNLDEDPHVHLFATYSVHVFLPADRSRGVVRKWHLTAYFSQQKLDSLVTLDTIPGVGDIPAPEGWFRSARASKARRDHDSKYPAPSQRAPTLPVTAKHPNPGADASPTSQAISHTRHSSGSSNPPSSSSPSPSPPRSANGSPNQGHVPLAADTHLVPLQDLQSMSYPRRDPTDEQLLMRFSLSRSKITRPPSGSF